MAKEPQITTLTKDESGALVPATSFDASMGYEGARYGREMALWMPGLMSADSETLYDRDTLVARQRDITRNSPLVSSGVTTVKDGIVGEQYSLSSKPKTRLLGKGFDDAWEEEFQEEVESLFEIYSESLSNHADAEGKKTLTDIIRLAVAVTLIDGEFFGAFEWLDGPGRPFKTAIQVIDGDRVCNPNGSIDSGALRAGIERDGNGRPIAYHVRTSHPNDLFGDARATWKRIPVMTGWGRLNILHVHEQLRASQTRGVSDMASAIKQMYLTKKFEDTMLQNVILRSAIAMSIESELPSAQVFEKLGALSGNSIEKAVGDYAKGFLGSVSRMTGRNSLGVDGVRIPHFHPGTKLNAQAVGDGGPLGTEFEMSLHRKIAGSLGLSYEEYARDFMNTNYSSARASMSLTFRAMRSMKRRTADRVANAIYRAWLEEMVQSGRITSMPRHARGAWLMDGIRLDALSSAEWIGASRAQIDERRETEAASLRIKMGLSTQEIECARLGLDWRSVNKQLQRESRMRQRLGISIDGSVPPMTRDERDQSDNPDAQFFGDA